MANDFLFNGQQASGPTGFTSTVQGLPDYYQTYASSLLNRGNQIATQPYQAYGGQRIAGFTDPQNQAFNLVQQNSGNYQPYLNQAQGMVQQGGQAGVDQSTFNQFLSPYTSGVVDQIAQLGQRNLSENLLPQVNSTFTGNGMFGSSRHGDFTGRAVRDANESILSQQSQALQSSYNSAMGAYQNNQNQQLQAGQAMGTLGQMQQQLGYNQAAQLQAVGEQQQNQNQKSLDTAYQDFQTQRDYPQQQLYMLSDMLRGTSAAMPKTATQTTQSSAQAGSPLSQIGSAMLGTAALNGQQTQNPYFGAYR